MSDRETAKNKHMSLDDRLEIQGCLDHGVSFKDIARRIGKDPTTISKEVKKHLALHPTSVKRTNCDGTPSAEKHCPSLLKAPFVCNPCRKRHLHCVFQKQLYNAKAAHTAYKSLLSESREGIPLSRESFYEADATISDGIKRGSIYTTLCKLMTWTCPNPPYTDICTGVTFR